MRSLLIVVTTLLAACAPCHSWDEIVLVDKAQQDDGEALATVRAAIDTFADWTQRDSTCVDRVKVKEKPRADGSIVNGYYRPLLARIVLRYSESGWKLEARVFHEFCHAVDFEEGIVSLDHAEALEPYTTALSEDSYPSADLRTAEAFARICADGPALHPRWRQVEEHCGDDTMDEAYQVVHEVMFSAHDRSPPLGSFEGSYQTWELAGTDASEGFAWGALVSGAEGLFTADTLYAYDEDNEWLGYQPVLRHIDPFGAKEIASLRLDIFTQISLDATDNLALDPWALLGSTTQPMLYDRFAPGTAYRVHSDPLALEATPFPALVEGARVQGFERDGALLALIDEGDGPFVATAALDDETWSAVSYEGEVLEDEHIQAFDASEEGALLSFYGEEGPAIAGLDFDGAIAWSTSLDIGDGRSDTTGVHRLPDGTALTTTWLPVSGNTLELFPLRYDPDDDSFSAPSSDCHTLRYFLDGVSWGGGYWMVYRPDEDDGGSGALTLMELVVEES
jgi:hypothetical protein